MASILKGAPVVAAMNERNAALCEQLKAKSIVPTLAVVRVGAREDDLSYERGVMTRCGKVGVEVKQYLLPADAAQDDLLKVIAEINADDAIHGCLLFRPLPKQFDDRTVRAALAPEKDIDGDILLLRMTLTNRTQIGYTTDFMRFYIQDAKIHKKTAVQQIEQNILFAFDYPEEIPAHESRTFTVAMNKFTIPDKKRLIIDIQERNGGRHFLYKLKNKSLLGAEEVFRSLQEQKTEDEADRILRRISR